jgi:hypothetical protein
MCACPEDRRKIYLALALRADVDREGTIRLSGNFDPDVCLPAMQGPPTSLRRDSTASMPRSATRLLSLRETLIACVTD